MTGFSTSPCINTPNLAQLQPLNQSKSQPSPRFSYNERVINGNEPLSATNIRNRWQWTIESRIKTDYLLTSAKFGNKKLSKKIIRKCWEGLIGKESDSLLDNPLSATGF